MTGLCPCPRLLCVSCVGTPAQGVHAPPAQSPPSFSSNSTWPLGISFCGSLFLKDSLHLLIPLQLILRLQFSVLRVPPWKPLLTSRLNKVPSPLTPSRQGLILWQSPAISLSPHHPEALGRQDLRAVGRCVPRDWGGLPNNSHLENTC